MRSKDQSLVCFGITVYLAVFCLSLFPRPALSENIALPDDVVILAPSPRLSQDMGNFIGRWAGKWSFGLPVEIVVENVDSNGAASIVYAYPDYPRFRIKAGYKRVPGNVKNGLLTIKGKGIFLQLKNGFSNDQELVGDNSPHPNVGLGITVQRISLQRQPHPTWTMLTGEQVGQLLSDKTATIWHERKEFQLWRYYSPDGKLFTKTTFSDEVKTGLWFIDESGRLCERPNPNVQKNRWCQVIAKNGSTTSKFAILNEIKPEKPVPRPIKSFTFQSFSDGNSL